MTSCGSSPPIATRGTCRRSPACGTTRTPATTRKWTYDPDFNKQSEDDGEWRNHSVRLTWQVTPRNKIVGWTDLHINCLHCDAGGSSSGLTFTGLVAIEGGAAAKREPPEQPDPDLVDVAGIQSPAARCQRPDRTELLVGRPAEEFVLGSRRRFRCRTTRSPSNPRRSGDLHRPQLPIGQLVGAHRIHHGLPGAVSYVTGSHSAKFGARFHQNDSTFPKNFYNNAQLKYNFRGGVPYQLTMYADQASDQHQQQRSSRSTRRIAGR